MSKIGFNAATNGGGAKVNKSLFNIEMEYLNIIDAIEMADGEITEEMEAYLVQNEEDFHKKAMSYIAIILEKKNHLLLIADQKKGLELRKKRTEKTIERLENTLLEALKLYGKVDNKGVYRMDVGTTTLSTRKKNVTDVVDAKGLLGAISTHITTPNMTVEEIKEVAEGKINIPYHFVGDDETPIPADGEGDIDKLDIHEPQPGDDDYVEEGSNVTAVEAAFLQNNLTYDAKFNCSYSDMLKVMKIVRDNIDNFDMNVKLDVKMPTSELTRVVKDSKGIRFASSRVDYNLAIKS